ncbi:PAQR family membrane homeostasis protein TrhA [Roseomonas xinghualingensis]|uniref:PAQR family membrane homeostasis protein TrhA n=1 Tax=Roseomonas xinghualingensis TaxID=2986475 RepID=UPI0021F16FDE|nr:hemolysin III family protein [Roseomonas sp. SXEYE001]MCV4209707.1 hemolysin III family protein [Roseomonas sp. SXEYE001]
MSGPASVNEAGRQYTDASAQGAPRYSKHERVADGAVHVMGLALVLGACFYLLGRVPQASPAGIVPALGLYAVGMATSFGCSAAYNLAPAGPFKALLRRFDHAAIFLMIAGTYTPIALLAIGGTWGWAVLAIVWTGAGLGATIKLLAPGRFERASLIAYLALGWVCLAALPRLIEMLTPPQFGLLVLGGVLYSLGVLLHLSTRLPYHNALWHLSVLIAAGFHYALVLSITAV